MQDKLPNNNCYLQAAEVFVTTALNDANDHVRYTASQLFKAHPYGKEQNDTFLRRILGYDI